MHFSELAEHGSFSYTCTLRLQCRPFLQQIATAAQQDPPVDDFPLLDKETGNFPPGNSWAKLYEKACQALGVEENKDGVDNLNALSKSNQNNGRKHSFLEICQKSDPTGKMIPWEFWSDPQPSPAPPTTIPHPSLAFGNQIAVIGHPVGLCCDCPAGVCSISDILPYRIGVGTVDCLGTEVRGSCKCPPRSVSVAVTNWLPHSHLGDHKTVPSGVSTPLEVDEGKLLEPRTDPYMWPIQCLEPIDDDEYQRLCDAQPATKKRGRPRKDGPERQGMQETQDGGGSLAGLHETDGGRPPPDTENEDSYSEGSELPDSPYNTDDTELSAQKASPPAKQRKTNSTKQGTQQNQVEKRKTRSTVRAPRAR